MRKAMEAARRRWTARWSAESIARTGKGSPANAKSALAARIGVSPKTIDNWVAGRSTPRADRLYRMADLFGVAAEELLEDV